MVCSVCVLELAYKWVEKLAYKDKKKGVEELCLCGERIVVLVVLVGVRV